MRRIGTFAVGLALLTGMGSVSYFNAEGADLSKGKSIYRELCMACRGLDGRGAGSVKLNPPPADLTSAGVQGNWTPDSSSRSMMDERTRR